MLVISKHALITLCCYFLVTICQATLAKHSIQQNETNTSQTFQESEKELINQTILDYDFFSYDIIDHKTLLIKFDITRIRPFQQSKILYDADLYVFKIPSINYKISIKPFSGYYEKEIDGTIIDYFTLCLVLTPSLQQKKLNITSNRNKTKTIFHNYLRTSYKTQQQQQYILHYCTKMGPDKDRHGHHKKQGSKGDYALLLLQVIMIGIFLAVMQIAHTMMYNLKYQELRQWFHRLRHDRRFRKQLSLSPDGLGLLRLVPIDEGESHEEEEEEEEEDEQNEEKMDKDEEDSLTLFQPRSPLPTIQLQRSRSPFQGLHPKFYIPDDDTSMDYVLDTKPWLQIPK